MVGPIELGTLLTLVVLFGGYRWLPRIARALGKSTREPKRGVQEAHNE